MVNVSRWIVRVMTLALVLQAPLAWAMSCTDHPGHNAEGDAENVPVMTMAGDCHEKMEMPGKANVDQPGDCCEGDCPCLTANSSFISDFSGSSMGLVAAQFQYHHISALSLQPSQVPTPPPNA